MRCTLSMKRAGVSVFALALAAILPAAASAQETDTAPQGPGEDTTAGNAGNVPIVVTARKREELLRDVPESITALSNADLTARGITSVADLGRQTPGLQLNRRQDNTPNVTLRGVGSFGNVQGVGFFIDDVQNFTDQTMRLEDLQRVEILKGPQGTLYGGSAIGGAVRYITVQPTFDTYVTGSAEIGEQNYHSFFGAVNTPLANDALAVRLSGYYTHDDGFVRDTNLGIWSSEYREYGARAQALLEIDRFSAAIAFRYRNYDGPGFAYVRQSDINAPLFDTTHSFRPQANRETWGGTATLNYDFDGVTLTSISSYTVQEYDYLFDADYTPPNTLTAIIDDPYNGEVLTQELRLTSDNESNVDWIFGLYGQQVDNINSIPTPATLSLFNGAVVIDPYSDRTTRQSDLAAFGTVNWDLGDFTIGGGLRLLHTNYKAHIIVFEGAPADNRYSVSDTTLLPRLSLSYRTAGDTLLYFNAARGYESGKVSLDADPALAFGPESAWTFELGARGQAMDGVLEFDAAVFYIDYSNKQAEDRFLDPNSGLIVEAVRNFGDSSSFGFEGSITVRPTSELSFYANGGYLRAEWDDGVIFHGGAPDEQDISGEDVPNSPRWSANFGADLRQPVSDNLVLSLHADAAYTDRFRWRLQNQPNNYNPSYWVANARIGIGAEDGSWELAGRVENLFNEEYYTEFSPGFYLAGAARETYNMTGVCPVATPRCNNGAPAPKRRFIASLAFRF